MNSDEVSEVSDRLERRDRAREDEAARLAEVRARGVVPDGCCPDIPEAPARGPFRLVQMQALYPEGEDGFTSKPAGYMGRSTMQAADAFDVMEAKARAAHARKVTRAKAAKQPAPSYRPPFTPGQVAMGRLYRDLVEKHACAGVKGSSLETLSQGGGGQGGEFIDAVLRDRQRLKLLQDRIGSGVFLAPRRASAHSMDRGTRRAISDRHLVDAVCIEGHAVSAVLTRCGWSQKADLTRRLTARLAELLDAMMGPKRRAPIGAVWFDSGLTEEPLEKNVGP